MNKLNLIETIRNKKFNHKDTLVITSSPRSGSTLLSQVLQVIPQTCTLFEPLHLKQVPEAKAAGFSWRTYRDPDESWPEGEAFLREVFQGNVINPWIARELNKNNVEQANRLIVKFVRANRLLPWLGNHLPIAPPILLIRHPCAVIASQLNYGWANASRPGPPSFVKNAPQFLKALNKTEGDEEFLAAQWALDHLPIFQQTHPHPCLVMTYEELILNPVESLTKVSKHWHVEINIEEALKRLKQPSSVVSSTGIRGIDGWQSQLSNRQIDKILHTTHAFDISIYTSHAEADYSKLYR